MKSHKPEHKLVRRNVVARAEAPEPASVWRASCGRRFGKSPRSKARMSISLPWKFDSTRTFNRSAAIRVYVIEYYRAALEGARQ
jgi:hypothetical protein